MNKKQLRYYLVRLRKIPNWSLIAITVFFCFVAVFALKANNTKMIELRAAVFEADKQNGDVEGALKALRQHVYSHMNTDLAPGENAIRPPIQLKYRYERLVAAEQAKLEGVDQDIYTDAQNYCEQRFPSGFSGSNRLPCIREYLDTHGGGQVLEEVSIPEDLYKFDFASPRWSPDLAGWSIVAAGLSGFVLVLKAVSELLIKKQLKSRM